MNSAAQSRLFVGCLLTSEVRMHLKKSQAWQLALVDPHSCLLVETHFQNQGYVGRFVKQDLLSLEQLDVEQQAVLTALQGYCAELAPAAFSIHIFPQLFIQ